MFFLRHNIKPQQKDHSVSAKPEPADNTIPDDTWFPIERLLCHKKRGKKVFYRVKWLDFTSSPSWVPQENVTQYAIDEYFIQRRSKSRQRRKRRG